MTWRTFLVVFMITAFQLGDVHGCCPNCCDPAVGLGVALPSFCPTEEPEPEPEPTRIIPEPECPSCCRSGCKLTDCGLPHCTHLMPTPEPTTEPRCPKCCSWGCKLPACGLSSCKHLLPTPEPRCPRCCNRGCKLPACVLTHCQHLLPTPKPTPETTPESTQLIDPACSENPGVQGHCKAMMSRWTYQDGSCVQFDFGGCGGNGNNFRSKDMCEATCMAQGDVCSEPPAVKGHCRAFKPRWTYEDGSCVQFIFGGCGGNGNNFRSKDMCEATCMAQDIVNFAQEDVKWSDESYF